MDKERFMKIALEEAYECVREKAGGPFGAVIAEGNKILARGHNTVIKDHDPTRHAEMNVISQACRRKGTRDLSGCIIFSTTEPCPMCFSAIHWARINKVVFGTGIEDVKKMGFNELSISVEEIKKEGDSPVNIERGFMIEECRQLLDVWSEIPDREVY
jgi:tRNA(Arg) A34 adenosine deaminase TadA